ncbi:hypothetical protein BH09ACT1_BH09ACT1_19940 [soil metagenome]
MDTGTARHGAVAAIGAALVVLGLVSIGSVSGRTAVPAWSNVNADLRIVNGQNALPARLKLGFSAGTGADSQFNEVNNLIVTTLAPDISSPLASSPIAPRPQNEGVWPIAPRPP